MFFYTLNTFLRVKNIYFLGKKSQRMAKKEQKRPMKNTSNQQPTTNIYDIESKQNALQHHFNLSKLFIFIDSIVKTFKDKEKPNHFSINDEYIWLYIKNESQNIKDLQYKYNDCKGWKLPANIKEKNNKKLLVELVNLAINSEDFKKSNKPKDNYFIKELSNNKPLTLLKAKDQYFVCFVIFGEYQKINCIDIDENKSEREKDFFKINNNWWDAKTIRKQAINIYAVYNKQMPQYYKLCQTIASKRKERAENKSGNKKITKYYYTDDSFLHSLLNEGLHLYNTFSHNSLLKHEFDMCAPGLRISYNSTDFLTTTEPMTRQEVFNYIVDRSGYCVLFYRYDLKERLKALKNKREQERQEQERNEWRTSDKTELKKQVSKMLHDLELKITCRTSFIALTDDERFSELKQYRDLYIRFEKQNNFDNYESISEWQKKFNEKMDDFLFYDRAIKKGLLNRIACRHHYEKQQDGSYKNISKDSFWRDPKRYTQEF